MAQTRTSTQLSILTAVLMCPLFVLMGCADDTSTQRVSDAQIPSVDQSMLSADATETDGALPDSAMPDASRLDMHTDATPSDGLIESDARLPLLDMTFLPDMFYGRSGWRW
jgi:hypothetical protein